MRSHDDLDKEFVNFFSGFLVNGTVAHQHTAKSRNGITGKGSQIGFFDGRTASQTAGVVVLKDSESRRVEFTKQVKSSIQVKQVVVRQLLAMELLKHRIQVAIKSALLVRVLAISQRSSFFFTNPKRLLLPILDKPVEDGTIVMRADGEGIASKTTTVFKRGLTMLFLEDLYEADLADGVLTEDGAADMIYDFLECLSRYPDYKSDALEGDIGQIIILGGRNADGSYFSSALTELFLKSQARLGKPDPKTFLRIGAGMPRGILETAVSCLAAKTGSPLFSNDDAVIPALLDAGIDREDAYSYCTSACWEPFIVGKSLDQNNIAVFDCFAALDEILRGDVDAFADFEELAGRYTERNRERFAEFLEGLNALKWAEDPLVSMFTEGCTESRTDISEGGCRYKNYGITTVGLPNAADSLFNIKKLVFDEKQYTLSQMETARRADFAGAEGLYRELKGLPHHFGHDGDEIIAFVNRVTKEMSRAAETYRNPYGGTVKFGLSSPGYNILSKKAAADYAGRKAGMPYNTHISCLDASYTEVASFAGRLDYTDGRFNGNVVDFFAPPDLPERNRGKFVLFLEGAVRAGFFQMQMNILDSATLKDAKAHPEKYRGLIVRVWGFSAYFNELPESYKDLMIERAEAAERIA